MFSDLHVFSFVLTQLNYADITILLPLHCIFRHLCLLIFILFSQMVCLDISLFSSNYPHQQFPSKIRHPPHTSFFVLERWKWHLEKKSRHRGSFSLFWLKSFQYIRYMERITMTVCNSIVLNTLHDLRDKGDNMLITCS